MVNVAISPYNLSWFLSSSDTEFFLNIATCLLAVLWVSLFPIKNKFFVFLM